jgi:hypothetical protein
MRRRDAGRSVLAGAALLGLAAAAGADARPDPVGRAVAKRGKLQAPVAVRPLQRARHVRPQARGVLVTVQSRGGAQSIGTTDLTQAGTNTDAVTPVASATPTPTPSPGTTVSSGSAQATVGATPTPTPSAASAADSTSTTTLPITSGSVQVDIAGAPPQLDTPSTPAKVIVHGESSVTHRTGKDPLTRGTADLQDAGGAPGFAIRVPTASGESSEQRGLLTIERVTSRSTSQVRSGRARTRVGFSVSDLQIRSAAGDRALIQVQWAKRTPSGRVRLRVTMSPSIGETRTTTLTVRAGGDLLDPASYDGTALSQPFAELQANDLPAVTGKGAALPNLHVRLGTSSHVTRGVRHSSGTITAVRVRVDGHASGQTAIDAGLGSFVSNLVGVAKSAVDVVQVPVQIGAAVVHLGAKVPGEALRLIAPPPVLGFGERPRLDLAKRTLRVRCTANLHGTLELRGSSGAVLAHGRLDCATDTDVVVRLEIGRTLRTRLQRGETEVHPVVSEPGRTPIELDALQLQAA